MDPGTGRGGEALRAQLAHQEKSKMVRGIHILTKGDCVAHIKKCKTLGITKLLCDGGGLYLRATPTGTASWVFRFEIDGVGREHGLGSYYTFDLDEAREKARRCRQLVAEGKDPIAEKQAARAAMRALTASTAIHSKSFKYCLTKYLGFNEGNWRSDKHRRDWESSVRRWAFPVLDNGNKLIAQVTAEDVLAILQPHWLKHNVTARLVRARIETVWDFGKGQKLCTGENPAAWRGNLSAHLPKVRKEVKHLPALSYHEVPALVAELRGAPDVINDALLYGFMTACRTKEVRFTDWSEIDLAAGVHTIASGRMKAGEAHPIPSTEDMVQLLERQPTRPRPGQPRVGLVFCGPSGRALSEGTMLARFKTLRPNVTYHGSVRSSFSTWASEVARARYEVREAALSHRNDPVVAAYMRSTHIGERRQLMEAWCEYILRPAGDNVTTLRREVG
jgi:integrase